MNSSLSVSIIEAFIKYFRFQNFWYTDRLIPPPLVHLMMWIMSSLQDSWMTLWSTASSIHVWSLLPGQILYHAAPPVLSKTYLLIFPVPCVTVSRKKLFLGTNYHRHSWHKFVMICVFVSFLLPCKLMNSFYFV